jgi:glycerophosphoryl diester phosphodiesterase
VSDEQTAATQVSSTPTIDKIVIAHRGASGYLPEHTLAAKAVAYAQGADYIEQDLVMTKDGEVIVLHDHHLDQVSNVRNLFPGRQRDDGRYYVIDFTLEEIRSLSVLERFEMVDGTATAVFPERFPYGSSHFRIHTFAEEIELIQGMNKSTGRNVGIYPEIKSPSFHRDAGRDLSSAVLQIMKNYGYVNKSDIAYLQCFDWEELQAIHDKLMPAMEMELRLVQLLGGTAEYAWIREDGAFDKLARVADGLGPSMHMIVERESSAADIRRTGLVAMAHAAGMEVHPYTFRRDAGTIPAYARDFDDLLDIFLNQVGVDGVFTDFPDLAVKFIDSGKDLN